jgi:hypothetical protein
MRSTVATLASALFSCGLLGCGDPCEDYCETFIDRTQECGLGGPSGESAVEQCGDEVADVLEDDACETANENVGEMSCEAFEELVCSTPDASSTFNCGEI